MNKVASVIEAIGVTSGYNDKLALLRHYADLPGLKDTLKFIYNPYCKTGIANASLAKTLMNWQNTKPSEITWKEAIAYFSTHQTGTDTDIAFAQNFIKFSGETYGAAAERLATAIVTQSLKIGISTTSLNTVYGSTFIPKTGCMLGTLFGDVGSAKTKWPCIVTEKLDGIRRILIKENGICRVYSRSGHEDTGLIEIVKEAKYLPNNFVYDGELLAAGKFKDNIALRQATNSIANSKGIKTGLTFNVFDMLPVEEFYAGCSKLPAVARKTRLGATLMDDSIQFLTKDWWSLCQAFGVHEDLRAIRPVPILGLVRSIEEVTPIVETIWNNGGEGVMLNTANGLYEIKRSKSLLKVKHTEEFVLPVIDVLEGSGKYEDALGALVVAYKGSPVGVGSGFTDQQRRDIWAHKDRYIGKRVEIECFGESTNQQGFVSLNCPIFKRFSHEVE